MRSTVHLVTTFFAGVYLIVAVIQLLYDGVLHTGDGPRENLSLFEHVFIFVGFGCCVASGVMGLFRPANRD